MGGKAGCMAPGRTLRCPPNQVRPSPGSDVAGRRYPGAATRTLSLSLDCPADCPRLSQPHLFATFAARPQPLPLALAVAYCRCWQHRAITHGRPSMHAQQMMHSAWAPRTCYTCTCNLMCAPVHPHFESACITRPSGLPTALLFGCCEVIRCARVLSSARTSATEPQPLLWHAVAVCFIRLSTPSRCWMNVALATCAVLRWSLLPLGVLLMLAGQPGHEPQFLCAPPLRMQAKRTQTAHVHQQCCSRLRCCTATVATTAVVVSPLILFCDHIDAPPV